jgi:hypothetical protein
VTTASFENERGFKPPTSLVCLPGRRAPRIQAYEEERPKAAARRVTVQRMHERIPRLMRNVPIARALAPDNQSAGALSLEP